MNATLPMPSLEFGALQKALARALCARGMTWDKFEVGAQLAKLEVSAQLEGFLESFLVAYPRLRGGLERFEATRAWVSRLVLALLLAWHSETEPDPRADWEARPFSIRETSQSQDSMVLASRARDFEWGSSLNLALVRVRSCVVWARFLS
jgi:hypothetical protein